MALRVRSPVLALLAQREEEAPVQRRMESWSVLVHRVGPVPQPEQAQLLAPVAAAPFAQKLREHESAPSPQTARRE
jgi:hypothetical protein